MQDQGDVIAVTAPVEFTDAGDRLQFKLTSGRCGQAFSITYNEALIAAHAVMRLMAERELAQSDRVRAFKQIEARH